MDSGRANSTNRPVDGPGNLLPLSPAVFNILLALSDGEARHGYGISKEVERRTGGTVRLGPGTLYGGVKRMISQGLIVEATAEEREVEDSHPDGGAHHSGGHEGRRRYYRITDSGRQAATAEAQRLEGLVRAARDRGLLPGFTGGPDAIPGEV